MKKADYSKIASSYDVGRPLLEQNSSLWLNLISTHSGISPGARVLDLGCGTGRFTLPMSNQLAYSMTGIDLSPEMLDKAKNKDPDGKIMWEVGNADDLHYSKASFNMIFMSHLLHHVNNPSIVLVGCNRIIIEGGVVLIRYGAMEQIREDPEHVFFPEVKQIDEVRTPSVGLIERWLTKAGFSNIRSVDVTQKTYETAIDRFQMTSVKGTSVLSMISDDAFKHGLNRMEDYIKEKPDDPWLLMDSLTLTIGIK